MKFYHVWPPLGKIFLATTKKSNIGPAMEKILPTPRLLCGWRKCQRGTKTA